MRPDDIQIRSALDYASGTGDRDGATIDIQGFDWVVFATHFAAIGAGATVTVSVEQGDESDLSDAAVATGSTLTPAADDDNQLFVQAIEKPVARYLRVMVDNDGANATAQSAIVILGRGRTLPALADITDEVTRVKLVSPADA